MLEYRIYQDCFSSEEMRQIWSEQATIEAWLDVEKVLARCQAEEGIISTKAALAIEKIQPSDLDHVELILEMSLVGRPIVGLVKQLRRLVGEYGSEVHRFSTTQDIMDTAMVWQMKRGRTEISTSCETLTAKIDSLIQDHGNVHIVGRTNGQHALPITLTTKFGIWRSELTRRIEALDQACARGFNVQVGGPVGDLRGYCGDQGNIVKAAVAQQLGLGVTVPHWQNARDGTADIVGALGSICAFLCKVGHNLNLLSSSDIAEVSEAYVTGQGASSAMHHKRNQRASEFLEAVARLGRQKAEQIGEFTLHQHERSGGAWIGEWVIVPEAFLLTSGALKWAEQLFDSLVVHSDAMESKCSGATLEAVGH